MMSKLFRLKEWLTLDEASWHFATESREAISEPDILRLALDGHITLSVRFINHASARVGRVVPIEEAERFTIPLPSGEWFTGVQGLNLGDGRVVPLAAETVSISEVWDLAMLGGERLDVEHRYQILTGGPPVELTSLDGVIVCRQDLFAQLQANFSDNEYFDKSNLKSPRTHPSNWYPAGSLPSDGVFVLRTAVIEEFGARLGGGATAGAQAVKPPPRVSTVKGGRPMSILWPSWVAELVALVHEQGVADGIGSSGSDELITRVANRLAERGLDGPTRSTVQETARAVLRRLRDAGN